MSSRALFTVTTEPLADACRTRASGEPDRSTARRLSSALDSARADGVSQPLETAAPDYSPEAGPAPLPDNQGP